MKTGIFSRTLLALTLAVPALALSACGDGDSKKDTTTGTGTAAQTSTGTAGTNAPNTNTGKTGGDTTGTKTGGTTTTTTTTTTSGSTSPGNSNTATDTAPAPQNLLKIAEADANLSTFVELAKLAGLEADLTGTTPVTIFAPTNAAFTKLGQATIDNLKADTAKLKEVLKGHIMATAVKSTDLADGWVKKESAATPKTDLLIEKTNAGVKVGPATVMTKDLVASNGVIHTIDTVILAPTKDVAAIIKDTTDLSTLSDALVAQDLVTALEGQGPFTIFAPNNKAFTDLGNNAPKDAALKAALQFHVGSLKKYSFEFTANESITTLLTNKKGTITLTENPKAVKYGEGTVVVANIMAKNGVIHIIDKVASVPTAP